MHSVAQNNTHYQDLFFTNITFFLQKVTTVMHVKDT